MNIGDELEILSNGRFRATPHRVVIPDMKKDLPKRQSIGFFANTDDNVLLEPIFGGADILNGQEKKKYEPITSKEHMDRLCRIPNAYLYE